VEGAVNRPRLFRSLFREVLQAAAGVESKASSRYAEAFYCRQILLGT
jgi:hypothetical protein